MNRLGRTSLLQRRDEKHCRKCGQVKRLAFFPKDRSRPDGHWHTCKLCNGTYLKRRGKFLALRRKYSKPSRSGLQGLRQYPHGRPRFSSLPPELRPVAEERLSCYLIKHEWHMDPARYARLVACAASHARLVGNRSWGLSMRAKKGWRTRERKQAEQEARLIETRARNAGKARVRYGLDGV